MAALGESKGPSCSDERGASVGRNKPASPDLSRGTVDGLPNTGRLVSARIILVGTSLLCLLGILTFAVVREATPPSRAGISVPSPPAGTPPRPPLTAAEEAYAHALWPIHTDVKLSAIRMSFAAINYKLREIERAELRGRVEGALEVHRGAAERMHALRPPASLERVHAEYLEALRLYERSAAEMIKVVADGRDEHLVAAYPLMNEAGGKLLNVGTVLWPGEYVPN